MQKHTDNNQQQNCLFSEFGEAETKETLVFSSRKWGDLNYKTVTMVTDSANLTCSLTINPGFLPVTPPTYGGRHTVLFPLGFNCIKAH